MNESAFLLSNAYNPIISYCFIKNLLMDWQDYAEGKWAGMFV